MRFLKDRLRLLGRETGVTLIIALATMTVLSIVGGTLMYYSSTNTRSANRSKADLSAFSLAEAGLQEAVAVLSNQPDPTVPTLLATRTSTYETGTVTWGGTYDSAVGKWTLTSTGRVRNPAGLGVAPSEAVRTVTAKLALRGAATQALESQAWNYLFSYGTGDPDGCDMDILSSVSVETRLLVSGNLCVTSSATIEGSTTQVLVGGTLTTSSSATVGKGGSNPVGLVDIAGGCRYQTGTLHTPCRGPTTPDAYADKVWANAIDNTPELQTAPTPNFALWYEQASPGATSTCTGPNRSGPVPVFDNDLVQDRDAPRANLTPSSSYTCRTYMGTSPLGELSWNNTTKTLTVRGTIFIDGDVQITQKALYTGQASLYVAGSLWMSGSNAMCAVRVGGAGSDCDWTPGAWDPNTTLLVVVTKGAGGNGGSVQSDTTVLIDSSTQWQGAIYGGPYKARLLSSIRFAGPVIADEIVIDSSLHTEDFATIVEVPSGTPGNTPGHQFVGNLESFSG